MSPAEQGQAGSIQLLQGVETPIITPLAEGQTLPTWSWQGTVTRRQWHELSPVSPWPQTQLAVAWCCCPSWPGPAQSSCPTKGCQLEVLSVHSGCSTGIWGTPDTPEQPLGISAVPWLSLTEAQLPHTHTDPGVRLLPAGLSLLFHSLCAQDSVLCAQGCSVRPQPHTDPAGRGTDTLGGVQRPLSHHVTHPAHLRAPPPRLCHQPKSHKWGKVTTKPQGCF